MRRVCIYRFVCDHACTHASSMTSGWLETAGAAKKSKRSSSEVCTGFDVGSTLLSSRPQCSHTSPYLPLMIFLTLIPLQLYTNSSPLLTVWWHVLLRARVCRNPKCINFPFLSPCPMLPNGFASILQVIAKTYQTELSCMETFQSAPLTR